MDTDPESVAFLANTAVSSAAILRSVPDAAQRKPGQVYMREVRYPDSATLRPGCKLTTGCLWTGTN